MSLPWLTPGTLPPWHPAGADSGVLNRPPGNELSDSSLNVNRTRAVAILYPIILQQFPVRPSPGPGSANLGARGVVTAGAQRDREGLAVNPRSHFPSADLGEYDLQLE